MHSRTSTKLSNRMYKKWVERFRMPFHVGVGIVCIFLYLILDNIKTAVPPAAALWIFGINFIIALVQWNHHRLYRFANSSRYMKGIPEKKLQVINGMYLFVFSLLIGGITFLFMRLPLMEIGTSIAIRLRDLLRFIFSGFAKTAISSSAGEEAGMNMGMMDYFADLRGDAPVNTAFGRFLEKIMIVFGIVLTCILVVYTFVTIYRKIWEKVRFQFDDEVLKIEKDEKTVQMQKKPISFKNRFQRDAASQFRKHYRKMIRRRLKKGSNVNPAWTPEEIEAFVGLSGEEGNQKIHEMYECIRYGRKEEFDAREAERLQQNMR